MTDDNDDPGTPTSPAPDGAPKPTPPPPLPSRGPLGLCNELLQAPELSVRRTAESPQTIGVLMLVALATLLLYGMASGFYQGGNTVWLSTLKAPLIVFGSVAICMPSLYVFSSLLGGRLDGRWLLSVASGLTALTGLIMLGLVPVVWLFSVSSRALLFVVIVHFVVWLIGLAIGYRFLHLSLNSVGVKQGLSVWIVLLCLVSFQLATNLRPVLYRPAGAPVWTEGKKFFVEHLNSIASVIQPPAKPERADGSTSDR